MNTCDMCCEETEDNKLQEIWVKRENLMSHTKFVCGDCFDDFISNKEPTNEEIDENMWKPNKEGICPGDIMMSSEEK